MADMLEARVECPNTYTAVFCRIQTLTLLMIKYVKYVFYNYMYHIIPTIKILLITSMLI